MRYENPENIEDCGDHYLIKCKNFRDKVGPPLGAARPTFLNVAITKSSVAYLMSKRDLLPLGRIFGILPAELPRITSAHQGLKRKMRVKNNHNAHKDKIVVVMHPTTDLEMKITAKQEFDGFNPTPQIKDGVFVALLTPNLHPEAYSEVDFWHERCNWLSSDPDFPQYPVYYNDRYDKPCIYVGHGQ